MNARLEILLVEDNEGDVEMTRHALSDDKSRYNISVANDGMEALDFLNKRGNFVAVPTPNLILLDLNMPRMDGKMLLETIKKEAPFKAIPVVILTSSKSPADIRECYELQASCYIVKPFDNKKFTETVRMVVSFWGGLAELSTL